MAEGFLIQVAGTDPAQLWLARARSSAQAVELVKRRTRRSTGIAILGPVSDHLVAGLGVAPGQALKVFPLDDGTAVMLERDLDTLFT